MASTLVWGLTARDLGHCLWNDLGFATVGFAGAAVAALTNAIFMRLSPPLGFLLGIIAGSAASSFCVNYAPFVILSNPAAAKLSFICLIFADVAFLFWVNQNGQDSKQNLLLSTLSVIALTTVGGALSAMGPESLYIPGPLAAFCVSTAFYLHFGTKKSERH